MTGIQSFIIDESRLPLCGSIDIIGRICRVSTNDPGLLGVLESICGAASQDPGTFTLQVFVDAKSLLSDGCPNFRGLHHLVFARFGTSNLFVFNIATRSISAIMTRALAHDRAFWQQRLIPIMVGVFGAAIDVLPLHAACLSLGGRGLLIAGASGTGKSNLSLALARSGAGFISDDWTYVTYDGGGLCAHGLSAPIKLLPDAATFFPALTDHELRISLNGELAYEVSPGELGVPFESECNPDCLVFYERVPNGEPELTRLSGDEARDYICSSTEPLPLQLSWVAEQRDRIASRIAQLACWQFRHSGVPQIAAQTLLAFFAPQEARMGA